MKRHPVFKRHPLVILLSGLLVGLTSMALFVSMADAATGPVDSQEIDLAISHFDGLVDETSQQQSCAECHPNVNNAWMASSHAHAYDDEEFTQRWGSLGKPGECLACHTTGYQSTTNSFEMEGVQCEACHGEMVEGHPPAVVPIRADTDYCGACHTTTLGEWRLTGHSTAGVGCMDCHDPHSQKLLFEDPDDLCLNCHKDDMGPYLEDIHIQKGIGCVDCHALVIPPDPMPVDGVVPTGHAFTMTTSTCVACHTDSLHAGFSLPGYENGPKAANGHSEDTGEIQPSEMTQAGEMSVDENLTFEQRIQALEAALASTRFSSLFQGGMIGLVLGGLTVYYLGQNQARKSKDVNGEETVTIVSEADGESIDRGLESVLVFIERGIEWVMKIFRFGRKTNNGEKPDDSKKES